MSDTCALNKGGGHTESDAWEELQSLGLWHGTGGGRKWGGEDPRTVESCILQKLGQVPRLTEPFTD